MLGDFVGQSQELHLAFDQEGTRALIAAIFSGLSANTGALVFGNGVKAILALLTATQDPRGVKLAGGAAAVGFAAFAAEEIEGALDHGLGAQERTKRAAHGGVGAPELLTELGEAGTQYVSLIQ